MNLKRVFLILAVNIGVLFLILIVVEGLSSFLLFTSEFIKSSPLAEQRHTQYDPDLGWANIPNLRIPNMYGPGIYLRINSQGFRNDKDFDRQIPAGKYRIVCSGDSFTLGYGVDNDHTWCQRLVALDPRLEIVNMGQGGYGVDQAYLWYKRDGSKLEHNAHLFAFVTADFPRMQSDKFLGYGKPIIKLENGALVVRNTPVPKGAYLFSYLVSKRHIFNNLHTIRLLRTTIRRFQSSPRANTQNKNAETQRILMQIFEQLKKHNEERSSKLIIVYLPLQSELQETYPVEWIKFIEEVSQNLEIPFVNVLDEVRSLPYREALTLFIPEGQMDYRGASGHLNDRGNEVVASIIYKEIKNHLSFLQ